MYPTRKWLLVGGLSFVAAIAGLASARLLSQHSQPTGPPPELVIAEVDLHLGTRSESTYTHRFTLLNPGENPITVLGIRSNCDCLRLSRTGEFVIPPHGKIPIEATFVLRTQSECNRWRAVDEQLHIPLVAVYHAGDGNQSEQSWEFVVFVKPSLRISEKQIELGLQSIKATIQKDLRVELGENVDHVESSGTSNWAVVFEGEKGRTQTAHLKWRGPNIRGSMNARMILVPVDKSGERLPGFPIEIKGEITEDIVAVPRALRFGRQKIGGILQDSIRFQSLSGRSLQKIEVLKAPPEISITPSSAPNGVHSAMFRITAAITGEYENVVEFLVTDQSNDTAVITVAVSYVGTER